MKVAGDVDRMPKALVVASIFFLRALVGHTNSSKIHIKSRQLDHSLSDTDIIKLHKVV